MHPDHECHSNLTTAVLDLHSLQVGQQMPCMSLACSAHKTANFDSPPLYCNLSSVAQQHSSQAVQERELGPATYLRLQHTALALYFCKLPLQCRVLLYQHLMLLLLHLHLGHLALHALAEVVQLTLQLTPRRIL